MIWKKYGKKCPNFQLLLCFGFCLSIWRLLSRLAAKKAPKKITDVSVGTDVPGISESIFFTELWYETIDFYGHWISVHWFMVFLGNFCHGIELWGEYWQNLVAILVVAAPYLSQPPTKNEGNKSTYPDIKANRWKHTKSMEEKNRLQHVEKLSPFFFLQFSKVLGAEHADNDSAGIKSFDYRFTSS